MSRFLIFLCFLMVSCKMTLNSSLETKVYYDNYKSNRKDYDSIGNLLSITYFNGQPFDSCYIEFDTTGEIMLLENYKDDKLVGDQMVFGYGGKLLNYRFFVGSNTYTYEQEFDVDGRIISKVMPPIVYSKADFYRIKDTLEIQMIFAKVPYKHIEIQISNDGINYRTIQLKRSKDYLNNYEYLYMYNINNINIVHVYLRMRCFYFMNETQMFYDTLSYSKIR